MCILYSKLVKESYLFLSQKLLNDIISVMLAQVENMFFTP